MIKQQLQYIWFGTESDLHLSLPTFIHNTHRFICKEGTISLTFKKALKVCEQEIIVGSVLGSVHTLNGCRQVVILTTELKCSLPCARSSTMNVSVVVYHQRHRQILFLIMSSQIELFVERI